MAKIGILTFHTAINYGAVLQAYALTSSVRSLGHETQLVNYEPEALRLAHSPTLRDARTLRKFAKFLLSQRRHVRRQRLFRAFVQDQIGLSPVVRGELDLSDLGKTYDAIIVGSDQVWNEEITGHDNAYLLPGDSTEVRRISYAASLGKTALTSERASQMRTALADFHSVSVREPSAAEALREAADVKAHTVLDPVFLLTADAWRSVATHTDKKGSYVLLYLVSANAEAERRAHEASERLGVPIKVVHKQYWRRVPRAQNLLELAPSNFLGLIDDAAMVVTNSFHGMSLSSILGTESLVVLNENVARNGRMEDLAEQLASCNSGVAVMPVDGGFELRPDADGLRVLANTTEASWKYLTRSLEGIDGDK